jgi:hypothetical protein
MEPYLISYEKLLLENIVAIRLPKSGKTKDYTDSSVILSGWGKTSDGNI